MKLLVSISLTLLFASCSSMGSFFDKDLVIDESMKFDVHHEKSE